MSSPKPNSTTINAASREPDDHHLVAKLRDIVSKPQRRTIGELATAIEQSLAELHLLKDRIDLIETPPHIGDDGLFTDPSSGATSAPGYHPSEMARRG